MQQAERLSAGGRWIDALAIYERVLQADPRDQGAYRMRALALAELGSAQLAAEAVWRHPDWFRAEERERIENDRLARLVGWADATPVDAAHRYAETDQALAQIGHAEHEAPRQVRWEATRLRADTLIALNRRQRHREVVERYRALGRDGVEVPGYALPAVADSLLALRRPRQAEAVLRQALRSMPGSLDARLLLGYALLEQERFDEAMPLFERLAAEQPAWPRRAGASSGYQNWDRLRADLALATARSAGDDNRAAEAQLRALAAIGPTNAELQAALAAIENRRARPQAALQRDRLALTLDPHQKDARIGLVENARDLDRIDQAEAALAPLRAEYPDDAALARLEDALGRYRGWQVHLAQQWGRGEDRAADASPLGNRDGSRLLEVESPLLGTRWRLGLRARDDWADFQGERVRYRSLGLGTHYRYDRLDLAAYAARTLDDYDRDATAWTLDAGWRFSDAWQGTLGWRRRDPEASLQARRSGVTADGLVLGLRWTPSEQARWDLDLHRLRYDDGNRRDSLELDGSQRLWTRPHLLVDGLLSASAGRAGGARAVDYYNPRRDASLALGLRLEQIGWRRYESAFRQRLELAAGPSWQAGHGMRWVPSLGYRHRWSLGDGSALDYGLRWSRPVYDGVRSQYLGLDLDFRWGAAP